MAVEIKTLGQGSESVLANIAADVFDNPLDPAATELFLSDPRHHIVVAIDEGMVVGFVSGVHYIHPDKPVPELFINEIGVAPSHQGQGIAKRLLTAMLEAGREVGCQQAWVLTEHDNAAAVGLYKAAGGEQAPADSVMFSFKLGPPLLKYKEMPAAPAQDPK